MHDLVKEKHKVRSGYCDRLPSTTDFHVTGSSVMYTGELRDMVAYIDAVAELEAGIIGYGSTRFKPVNSEQRHFISHEATQMIAKVKSYLELPDNWDSQGALTPTEDVINTVISFIVDMDQKDLPFFFTAPGPNGEIIVEFKKNEKAAEVFFEHEANAEMILYSGSEQIYAGGLDKKRLERLF